MILANSGKRQGGMNPQQLETCMSKHTMLQGKDVLVNLPTGYGKTFVYQLLPIAVTEILRSFFLLGDRSVLFKKRAKRFDLCLRLLARASLVPDPVRRPPF